MSAAGATVWHRVRAHVRLARPLNAAISLAGVFVGGWLAAGASALAVPGLGRAALAAALLGSAANALNDSLDVTTDRVNRPARPIPSGLASVRSAQAVWLGLTVAALGLAASVSLWHVAVAAVSAVLLGVYTRRLKPRVLVGNVAVASVVALAVAFGARAVAPHLTDAAWLGVGFAFLVNLARELVKDVEDAPGDAAAGLRTLPVVMGTRRATALAIAVVAVVLGAVPLPVAVFGFDGTYFLGALAAALALLVALRALAGDDAPGASRALKGAMLAGLVALVLGAPA